MPPARFLKAAKLVSKAALEQAEYLVEGIAGCSLLPRILEQRGRRARELAR